MGEQTFSALQSAEFVALYCPCYSCQPRFQSSLITHHICMVTADEEPLFSCSAVLWSLLFQDHLWAEVLRGDVSPSPSIGLCTWNLTWTGWCRSCVTNSRAVKYPSCSNARSGNTITCKTKQGSHLPVSSWTISAAIGWANPPYLPSLHWSWQHVFCHVFQSHVCVKHRVSHKEVFGI